MRKYLLNGAGHVNPAYSVSDAGYGGKKGGGLGEYYAVWFVASVVPTMMVPFIPAAVCEV